MRKSLAATVTMDDLKVYFKGERWYISEIGQYHIEAHSENYDIAISTSPGSFLYAVSVEALEDSSDKDEKVTDNPVGFLKEFLGHGGGQDLTRHLSSSPASLSERIRVLAAKIELGECEPRKAAMELRRVAMLPDASFTEKAFSFFSRYASREEIEKEELSGLMAELKNKKWQVEESTADNGMPELTVDISGIYTAKISIDSIPWSYDFSVRDVPESKKEGVTDDPISEFREFYKSPETEDAKKKRSETRKNPVSPPEEGTINEKRRN